MSHLRAFLERIERLKEEEDALKQDVREVYAEAASAGYDKTALGQVVTLRRKRAKNPDKFEEQSTIVQLYLDEIEGSPRVHARVKASELRPDCTQGSPALAGARSEESASNLIQSSDRAFVASDERLVETAVAPAAAVSNANDDDGIPAFLRRTTGAA